MQRVSQSPRDPAFVQNPYPFYARTRAAGPLFHWEDYGFPCAVSYAAVNAILRDRRFGREPPDGRTSPRPDHLRHFYAVDDLSMLDREPPAHTRLRALVLRAFTPRRIAAIAPDIAALANRLADEISDPEFDLLPVFAERLPVIVIARLLGVPDEMAPHFLAWSHAMVAMYQARRDRAIELDADRAARDFAVYLRAFIVERRRKPADDLISQLIAAEEQGDRLSEDELIATCILILNAGHEATVHGIGNGVRAILSSELDPAQILSDPERVAGTVDEILRLDPPLHLFTRIAKDDVEIFGHAFRRGETVGCLLAAANHDPDVFPEPARFDPARHNAAAHLSFGAGIHFCLGAPLARIEMGAALPALFRRFPRLTLPGTPVFADRYHFHGLEHLRLENDESR